jgi:tRNA threonylcarbamoyladenosine biosynthesis protein TsaE
METYLADLSATEVFGKTLFQIIKAPAVIFLEGNLGAGKTTLVRSFLRAGGYNKTVKSPTYNLVEEYKLSGITIYHFDLYRLNDPEELEWIGIKDYFNESTLCFIEWPQRGQGYLPAPDWIISLKNHNEGRMLKMRQTTKK